MGELELSKWNGEAYLKVKTKELPEYSYKYGGGQFDKFGLVYVDYTVLVYEKEIGTEYEIIFNSKPKTNVIELPIETENLVFYYQPPLTKELNPDDYGVLTETEAWKDGVRVAYRPENVVGSLAVYHTSKRNNEYKTGKAFHIYRPLLIDDSGKKEWAELSISNGFLRITLPQKFLDMAKYPILLDPTFGKTNIGGSNTGHYTDKIKYFSKFPLSEDGDVTKITGYFKSDGNTYNTRTGSYTDNAGTPDALKISSAEVSINGTPQWRDYAVSPAVSLTAATYWLGAIVPTVDYFYYYYDDGAENSWNRAYDTYSDGFEDPYGEIISWSTKLMSIYATYTAAGGETYERDVDLGLNWAGEVSRTWNLTRVFNLGLDWSGDNQRKWDATRIVSLLVGWSGSTTRSWSLTRGLTLALDWSGTTSRTWSLTRGISFLLDWSGDASYPSMGEIFSRVASLGISWASSLSRQVNFNRVSQITVDFTFNLPGLVANTIRIWVKTLQGTAVEDAVVTLSNPSTGAILWAYYTDSEGYTPQEDLETGSYLLEVIKEQYQPYNDLFNFTETTVKEVPLRSISGGAFWWFMLFPMFLLGLYVILQGRR